MHRNQTLYTFLVDKIPELTDKWYNSLNKCDEKGIYSSTDPTVIKQLKEQHDEFQFHFCEVFLLSQRDFNDRFHPWIKKVAQDVKYQHTPLHLVVREFMKNRELYFTLLDEYISNHQEEVTEQLARAWEHAITSTFDDIIFAFSQESHHAAQIRLEAQRELINELSTPIIHLNGHSALLPLVGTIDDERAKMILENVLEQCTKTQIAKLYIDLSGVVIVNRIVGHQLFQLIDSLRLVGTETILCGIREEVAKGAIRLGMIFEGIEIRSSLSQALAFQS
ncbi:STAS domain-containing protein [Priestia koreensis]|uniref:STAS domain-containing protein n=1 Tax=Priestia koreensis TaxID=284581 RepID=UPI002040B1E5|nr:STAS domain-containing protein [Priestia koreensis]MCM3006332.1 STAS domain-containing protein [Priestia koreensis]